LIALSPRFPSVTVNFPTSATSAAAFPARRLNSAAAVQASMISTKRAIRCVTSITGVASLFADQKQGVDNLGIAGPVNRLVEVVDSQVLQKPASARRDFIELPAQEGWSRAFWRSAIQPIPKSRRFESPRMLRHLIDPHVDGSSESV
jgi:hypothetical protein